MKDQTRTKITQIEVEAEARNLQFGQGRNSFNNFLITTDNIDSPRKLETAKAKANTWRITIEYLNKSAAELGVDINIVNVVSNKFNSALSRIENASTEYAPEASSTTEKEETTMRKATVRTQKANLTAYSYTANHNGDEKVDAKVTVKDLVSSIMTIEESTQRLEYWNTLEHNVQEGHQAGCGSEGDTPKIKLINGINEAWRQSPGMVEKRRIEKENYDNELLKCDRTGNMVSRKDCVILPSSVYSIVCLTDFEKEFLGV